MSKARLIGVDLFDMVYRGHPRALSNELMVNSLATRLNFITRLTLLKGDMREVCDKIPDESINLFFIDGNHEYEFVKSDLQHAWPKVKKGGVLAGHDFIHVHPGVIKAVQEWDQYPRVKIPNGSSIFYVEK